jgi:hypothetical protein
MKTFKENDIVIYTDNNGNRFDTFVIFDTNTKTGLTHINHYNLRVSTNALELHPSALTGTPMPMSDMLSFNLFNKLKEKYTKVDQKKKKMNTSLVLYSEVNSPELLHKAS